MEIFDGASLRRLLGATVERQEGASVLRPPRLYLLASAGAEGHAVADHDSGRVVLFWGLLGG